MRTILLVLGLFTLGTVAASRAQAQDCEQRVLGVCGKRPGIFGGAAGWQGKQWNECRERTLNQCYAEQAAKQIQAIPSTQKIDATVTVSDLEARLKDREEEIQQLRAKVDELTAKVDLILLTLEALQGKKQ